MCAASRQSHPYGPHLVQVQQRAAPPRGRGRRAESQAPRNAIVAILVGRPRHHRRAPRCIQYGLGGFRLGDSVTSCSQVDVRDDGGSRSATGRVNRRLEVCGKRPRAAFQGGVSQADDAEPGDRIQEPVVPVDPAPLTFNSG
jgi:hypothetical protein